MDRFSWRHTRLRVGRTVRWNELGLRVGTKGTALLPFPFVGYENGRLEVTTQNGNNHIHATKIIAGTVVGRDVFFSTGAFVRWYNRRFSGRYR